MKSTWKVPDGVRIDAVCRFAVNDVYKPETIYFGIDFGLQVKDFVVCIKNKIPSHKYFVKCQRENVNSKL